MKKIFTVMSMLLAMAALGINMSSCSSDDEEGEEETVKYNITGVWTTALVDFDEPAQPSWELMKFCSVPHIEFKSGGTVEWYEWDFETGEQSKTKNTGSWVIKGNELTISSATPSFIVNKFTIRNVTKDKIELYLNTTGMKADVIWAHPAE